MSSVHPPLVDQIEIFLKIMQQVGRWHGTPCEEVGTHPTFFKIIRCRFVIEDVQEEFALRLERLGDLCHEKLVILHMLEQFDRYHSIKSAFLEVVVDYVSRDDLDVS